MMDLPDINVWLAIVDENHSLHTVASAYWSENADVPKGFCRVTMLGFLRLSTHPGILHGTLSAGEAWGIYHAFLSDPIHRFFSEPETVDAQFAELTAGKNLPHRLWTDAYLAAFAISGGLRLVSFDSDFALFPGLDFLLLEKEPK